MIVPSAFLSTISASNASVNASDMRGKWRNMHAKPPKLSGDCIPEASPICNTRSNCAFNGEFLYVGKYPNNMRLNSTSSSEFKFWYLGIKFQ